MHAELEVYVMQTNPSLSVCLSLPFSLSLSISLYASLSLSLSLRLLSISHTLAYHHEKGTPGFETGTC